jgi:lethal(2) giant larvae protein
MFLYYLIVLQVGCFDPYSDDPRLAVKKIALCPFTGTLVVAGTAGHLIVAKLNSQNDSSKPDIKVCHCTLI